MAGPIRTPEYGGSRVQKEWLPQIDMMRTSSLEMLGLRVLKGTNYAQFCKCTKCGKVKLIQEAHLRVHVTASCKSCMDVFIPGNGLNPKLGKAWENMKTRCYNPNQEEFHNYGGRGIVVCEEWKNSKRVFVEWAMKSGYQDGLSLDRIDVNGNYEPGNCRWATDHIQTRNMRRNRMVTFNGKTQCITDWATELDISVGALKKRIKRHGVEYALTAPLDKNRSSRHR